VINFHTPPKNPSHPPLVVYKKVILASVCVLHFNIYSTMVVFFSFSPEKKYFKSFVYLNEFYLELPLQESERVWRIVLRVDRKNRFLPRSLHFFSALAHFMWDCAAPYLITQL
jgi:hypothetical protein